MGGKQSVVEENAPASPRSPTSPRVVPVDGDTPLPELLDNNDASRGTASSHEMVTSCHDASPSYGASYREGAVLQGQIVTQSEAAEADFSERPDCYRL